MVSAVAAFVRPSSGEELAVGIANWGTLTGALCFALAGVLQEFERPAADQARRLSGVRTCDRSVSTGGRFSSRGLGGLGRRTSWRPSP